MAKTIFYSLAALVRKKSVLPLENKIHIFAPPCNILYICIINIIPFRKTWVLCVLLICTIFPLCFLCHCFMLLFFIQYYMGSLEDNRNDFFKGAGISGQPPATSLIFLVSSCYYAYSMVSSIKLNL